MIRLHVIVEGQTEETFVRGVLAEALWPHQIFPDAHRITTGRKRFRVFRGGLTTYQHLRRDLLLWMKQDQNPDAYFTTMVDLYRLPPDFPGYSQCRTYKDPLRKVECLESSFQAEITHPRFIPYLQLHEFESLLFSDPNKIVHAFPGREDAVQPLEQVRSRFSTPEHINDGEDTSPSRQVASVLPEYVHAKPVAGPVILTHIGMTVLRRECAHFNGWVQRLERCGETPGV